jgi:hypothetical protein
MGMLTKPQDIKDKLQGNYPNIYFTYDDIMPSITCCKIENTEKPKVQKFKLRHTNNTYDLELYYALIVNYLIDINYIKKSVQEYKEEDIEWL